MDKGFGATVVAKSDFKDFDEVVTLLDENGRLVPCLSRGSRKITSKNGRHLIVGYKGKAEVFLARHEGKMSKLKKFVSDGTVPNETAGSHAYNIVLELAAAGAFENKNPLGLLEAVRRLVAKAGDDRATVYAVLASMQALGVPLLTERCTLCDRTDSLKLSFAAGGMKCPLHYAPAADGVVSQEATNLVVAVAQRGAKPLLAHDGPLGEALWGVCRFFADNSGFPSRTVRSLLRRYGRALKG